MTAAQVGKVERFKISPKNIIACQEMVKSNESRGICLPESLKVVFKGAGKFYIAVVAVTLITLILILILTLILILILILIHNSSYHHIIIFLTLE